MNFIKNNICHPPSNLAHFFVFNDNNDLLFSSVIRFLPSSLSLFIFFRWLFLSFLLSSSILFHLLLFDFDYFFTCNRGS